MPRRRRAAALRHALLQPAPVLYACEMLEPRTLLSVITINGTAGNDVITLSSHSLPGAQYFVDYSINGGPTVSVPVLPTDSVFVDTGTGTDQVNLLSTPPVPTLIQGDSPSDNVLNIGGPSGLQGILGSIQVTTDTAFWDITADDSSDTTSRTGTLSDGSLTGLAPANITWDPTKCHGLAIDMSSAGGNTFSVYQTNVSTLIRNHSSGKDDSLTIGSPTRGMADITAALSIGNVTPVPSGLVNLTLDDQADPTYGNYILDDASLSLGTGNFSGFTSQITWNASVLRSLTLKTQAQVPGHDAGLAEVVNTVVPTTIVGDSAGLSVGVGENLAGHPQVGLLGNVYITNLAGGTALDVRHIGAATPQTVTLHTVMLPGDSAPYGAIDGLAPATIAYRYADTASAHVTAGGQNVEVVATGTNVLIDGTPAINVGDAGSIQNITDTLSIFAGSVTIDDWADATPRTATISLVQPDMTNQIPWTTIGGLSSVSIQYFTQAANTLTINGGAGANTYIINAPPLVIPPGSLMPSVAIVLNTGIGNDSAQILATGFGQPLTVNGQGGNDAFIVTYSDSITDNLVLNGGGGSSTLTLLGATPAAQFGITPGTITFGMLTTTYTAMNTLALDTGTFTITGDLAGVSLSTVGVTTAKFETSSHIGALNIGGGTLVALAPGAMPLSTTLFCTGLSIDTTGKLDLANNALQLSYSGADPVATVRSYLVSGYNGGAWTGASITTSAADSTHTLGFGDSADGVVPGLAANTILVRFTRVGDVNLDGTVDFADLVTVARNYGKTGQNWDQGDVNYDGTVGFDDLVAVSRNYGMTAAVQSAASPLNVTPTLAAPIVRKNKRR